MNKKRRKIFLLLLVFVMFLPNIVQAHDVYYLQTLIDDMSIQYKSYVIKDEVMFEGNHIENKQTGDSGFSAIGTLSSSINFFTGYQMGSEVYKGLDKMSGSNDGELVFSFPPKEVKNSNGAIIQATGQHIDKVHEIKSILIPQLNEALRKINGGKSFNTVEDLIKASQALLSNDMKDWKVTYSQSPDENGLYLATLTNNDTDESFEYQYAIEKGYADPKSPLYHNEYKKESDVMTWHQLVAHANYFYFKDKPLYSSNFAYANQNNFVEGVLLGATNRLLNGLKDVLEIFSIEDLVFNQGIRGLENVYYKGALTVDGLLATRTFYAISLCIALSLLISSVVYLLFKRTWATMNTRSRVDLMEGIQNIIITAFMLGFTYVFASILLDLNSKVVNIFAGIQGGDQLFTSADSIASGIGAILMSLFYFFICCYMNFVYIMRSIWLIILLGTGPLWIVGLSFGDKGKKFTSMWFKYIVLNVFLQSFHAVFLTIFHNTLSGMRGIEAFVLCFSLIPLTSFFKKLILGDDGDFGGAAFMSTARAVGGIASNLTSSSSSGGSKNSKESKDSSKPGVAKKDDFTQKKKDKQEDGDRSSEISASEGASRQSLSNNDTYSQIKADYSSPEKSNLTVKERMQNLKDGTKEGISNFKNGVKETFTKEQLKRGAVNAGGFAVKAGKKVASATVQNAGAITRGSLKIGRDLGMATVGAGMFMATGGSVGGELMNKAAKNTKRTLDNGARNVVSGGSSILKESYNEQRNQNEMRLRENEIKGTLNGQSAFSYSEKLSNGGSVEHATNEGLYVNKGISNMYMQDENNMNVDVDFGQLEKTSEDYLNYNAIKDIHNASNYDELKDAVGSHAEKIASFRGESNDFINNYKDYKVEKLEKSYDFSPKTNVQEKEYFNNYKKNYLDNLGVSKVEVVSNPSGDANKDLMRVSYNKEGQKQMGISNVVRNEKRTSVTRNDIASTHKFSYNINEVNTNMGKVSYQKQNKANKNFG